MINYIATDTLTTNVESRNLGIINFGTDNLYPNYSTIIGTNSAGLRRCLNVFQSFVYGAGMTVNAGFWKMPVNIYGLRVDQLLRRLVSDYSIHKGFAFKVIYNAAFERVGVVPVNFEQCRLVFPDDAGRVTQIKVCKDWSAKRINAEDVKTYDAYTDDINTIIRQVENAGGFDKWNGHLYYYGSNGEVKYPHSMFHDVLEDCLSDIAIKKGKNSNVHTNFMASHLLQLPFKFDDIVKSNSANTVNIKAEAEVQREAFKEEIKKFQAAENQGKILLIENPLKDQNGNIIPIKLDKFDIQDYDKVFELTERTIKDNIRGAYQIPAILLDPVATGFSTEIMQSFYNYYNIITSKDRQIFEEVFMEIFKFWHGSQASNDYSIEPLQYMGDEETGGILAVQLGVGGTTAMQSILVDPILTVDQKIGILQVLFGLDEATSKLMLGIK
jgi:hypothetical protein